MRVVFMGTPSYATQIFKALNENFEVVGVFTKEDKIVGRKKILTPPHLKQFLLENDVKIPIFQPKNLKNEYELILSLKPDFIVVAAYGQILPKNILNICPCINLHASILPQFRGASPIQSTILTQQKYGGVSAMLMDEGLDTGDILAFSYLKIDENTNFTTLFEKLSDLASTLCVKTIKNFHNILPIKQNNALSSYSPKITKLDGLVDVDIQCAKSIYVKSLAFNLWPHVYLPNGVKLVDFEIENSQLQAGVITHIQKEFIKLTCKQGTLIIKQLQPPSKQIMSAYSYILGLRKKVGDRLY